MASAKTAQRPPTAPAVGNGARPQPGAAAAAKRSAPMALAGLAAIVVGALVFAGLHVGLDRRRPVLVVTRPVAAGALITAQDLGETKASVGSSMAVPASQRRDVVGKAATTALAPGSLLAPSQVGGSSALRKGEALVGLALKSGQYPAALRPGNRVQVVDTGREGGSDQARPVVLSDGGVVTAVGRPEASTSATAVTLSVPEPVAAAVASAGAAGRVSLVVLPAS